jgi:ferredoxin-thioredoxin reductase catalytic subunit
MNENELFEMLRKVQEPKGYYFNNDHEFVLDLIRSLLVNKERYGHMSCPCRLATGDKDKDRDILCPCVYRAQDVEEYGSCFCGLYVSRGWNEGRIVKRYVPERRPPEKTR